jgi:uncharacterized membrane protein
MAKMKINTKHQRAIQGFDIELNREKLQRIDRLVDDYEKSIMLDVDAKYVTRARRSDRIADSIAAFGGSWKFIGIFAVVLFLWVLWNTLPFLTHFDPQPFILLNLCLSFIAAFQAPIIMMSQNRQASRDKHESIIDFAINYKAEQEIDDIQHHLHRLELEICEMKGLLKKMDEKFEKKTRKQQHDIDKNPLEQPPASGCSSGA